MFKYEQIYHRAFESNPNPMCFFDQDTGVFFEVNQAAINHYGYSKEEFLEMMITDIYTSIELSRLHQINQDLINTEQYVEETKHYKKDGSVIDVEMTMTGCVVADKRLNLMIIKDISTVKLLEAKLQQTEALLRQSEEKHRLVLDLTDIASWDWNLATGQVFWSDKMFNLLGLNPQEVLPSNDTWRNCVHPEDLERLDTVIPLHLQNQQLYEEQYRVIYPDGTIHCLLSKGYAIYNETGQAVGMGGITQDITKSKELEKALDDISQKFSSFINCATFNIAMFDRNMHYLGVSQSWIDTYQLGSIEKVIGQSHYELFPNLPERWLQVHQEAFAGNKITSDEDSFILADGSTQWMKWEVQPWFLKTGELGGLIIFFEDITRQKQSQEEIKILNNRLSLALKSGGIGCWDWNIPLNKLVWDEQLCQLYGLETDSDIDYNLWANALHPDDRLSAETVVQQALWNNMGYDTEFRIVLPDGNLRFLKSSAIVIKDSQGSPQSMIGVNFDITKEKQTEKALRESQQFLQTVLDTFPLSVFWKDRNSVFLGCNYHFLKDAGLISVADIVGKTDYDLPWGNTEADAYRADDKQVMNSKTPKLGIIETQFQANGEKIWLETNKLPLYSMDGNVLGVLGTYQDITERKQAEEQLELTNTKLIRATRLKDEFLANMSHELRTPLNAILGMTEILQEEVFGTLNIQQVDALQTIENSGSHLLLLINDILDIAKIESGEIELKYTLVPIIPICYFSTTFIQRSAGKKNLQLETKFPPNLPNLLVDERRIRQVLINLLSNAVKFTPEGGRVTLEVSLWSEKKDSLQDNYLRIAITDTGIGIAAENINKLFKPFVQLDSGLNREYEGTGLGLALVKQIIELHKGKVGVTSELGVGSCFTIDLPFQESNYPSSESRPLTITALDGENFKINPRRSSYLILLAEDNESNIQTFKAYLEAMGYRLIVAKNGPEAINLAFSQCPDLILMDIQMPGMSGLEAIREIRSTLNLVTTPIIALTALAMEGDRELCLEAGANEYLAKPVKLKQLITLIQTLLN